MIDDLKTMYKSIYNNFPLPDVLNHYSTLIDIPSADILMDDLYWL